METIIENNHHEFESFVWITYDTSNVSCFIVELCH